MMKRFDYIQQYNDRIAASNSCLTEIIATCDYFKNEIDQTSRKIAEKSSTKIPEREETENFSQEIISILTASRNIILGISQQKVKDQFTQRQLKIIRSVYENILSLTRVFFSFKKVPMPQLSSKTLSALMEPLDPMRFTQLFDFPEDFSERSAFEQSCAFQAFYAKLDGLLDAFSKQQAYLLAKSDDTKTMLLYPQEKTLETYPRFLSLLSLHKKLRQELIDNTQSCNTSGSKLLNILVQIKNRLNSTSQFFTRSINEMREETKNARADYVSTCLILAQYRAIEQICDKSEIHSKHKHADDMRKYLNTENKFVGSIIDYDKLKKFKDDLIRFITEAEQKNQKFKEILELLNNGPNKAKEEENEFKESKAKLRTLGEYLEEELQDGFAAYIYGFKIAADMVQNAEDYMQITKNVGHNFDNMDHMVNTVSTVPSNKWALSIQTRLEDLINNKKESLEDIKKEVEKLNQESDQMKQQIESSKRDKSDKEKKDDKCHDCQLHPKMCICSCGHTFCDHCFKEISGKGKCPICNKEFKDDDVIEISW